MHLTYADMRLKECDIEIYRSEANENDCDNDVLVLFAETFVFMANVTEKYYHNRERKQSDEWIQNDASKSISLNKKSQDSEVDAALNEKEMTPIPEKIAHRLYDIEKR